MTREEFFRKHKLAVDRPLIAVLPGSRRSEALRHLPELMPRGGDSWRETRQLSFHIAGFCATCGAAFFEEPLARQPDPGDRGGSLGRDGLLRCGAGGERNGYRGSGAAGCPDGDVITG